MAGATPVDEGSTLPVQLPDMSAAADRALDLALESCAKLMDLDTPSAAAYQIRQGNVVARMHCCTSITQEIAKSLGTLDQNVRAVFAPDHDLLFENLCSDGKTQGKPMVSLMVWARHKSAKLDSLVAAWNRALVEACREKIRTREQTPLLDVHTVDDDGIRENLGADCRAVTATRVAVYWIWSTKQVVDIIYDRGEELQ